MWAARQCLPREDWEPDAIPLGKPPTVAIVVAAVRTDATDVRDALAQYAGAAQLESEWRWRFRNSPGEISLHIPGIAFKINKRSAYKGNIVSYFFLL